MNPVSRATVREVPIIVDSVRLNGALRIPDAASGIVLFAHGSGSGRHSPRNTYVAERLGESGLATLLFDLLTEQEEAIDARTAELRFDIALLTDRLVAATTWTLAQRALEDFRIGYFGASTGAAAALAAAARVQTVSAVVSRGGRPDLAGPALTQVRAATLLIVGGDDHEVLALNRRALKQMRCEAKLEVVPGATHLFVEPGTLEQVAALSAEWFSRHCQAAPKPPPG
jgi:dienelactone hydrolase